jgi:hypothetical protein
MEIRSIIFLYFFVVSMPMVSGWFLFWADSS